MEHILGMKIVETLEDLVSDILRFVLWVFSLMKNIFEKVSSWTILIHYYPFVAFQKEIFYLY